MAKSEAFVDNLIINIPEKNIKLRKAKQRRQGALQQQKLNSLIFYVQHTCLYISLALFCTIITFYEKRKCRMSSPKILCSVLVFLFALFFSFFFFAGVHFYLASCSLLKASISHFKIFSCCFSEKKGLLIYPSL